MKVRTRFAPSPTGYMHVGNLRTALYAYLWAKKNKGTFILRIEDTDQERIVEGSVELIYHTLAETGLIHDEGPDKGGAYGPYIQHERKPIYKKYAEELIEKGVAYYCFCDKERLEELRTSLQLRKLPFRYDGRCKKLTKEEVREKLAAGVPHVVRQSIPTLGATAFSDEVYGTITVDNSTLDDQVLVKSDGLPTYNFANVVDDHLMEITHVIRGSEYLSSTPKYNLLYQAFGWEIPHYVHCSQVMRDAQHKLSKRDGDASYADFVEKGYLKEAIINYIALLGWNPGTEREKFTLEELVEAFDLGGISRSPAIFDVHKLTWLNGQFIPQETFAEHLEDRTPDLRDPDAATMLELAQSFQATKGVTFESGSQLASGQRRLQYLEQIEGRAGNRGQLDVPSVIKIQVPVWRGIALAVPLTARFRFRISREGLLLAYVIDQLEDQLDAAWTALLGQLTETLPVPVLAGRAPSYGG